MFEVIGTLGRVVILLGFIAAIVSIFSYFRALKSPGLAPLGRAAFHSTTTMVFITSAALFILILKHQFQYHYVWAYSSTDLPLGLLMSTFYAGQEGSFLLWTLMVAIIGIILLNYTRRHDNEREVMGVYSGILAFLMLLLVVKNPFALNEAGMIPTEGKGLNPLLQNFWMQIHPPILFIGFAAMAPPFALAISALIRKRYQNWIVSALPWVVGGSMVLGLGIALGGYWAYETLGWGGWWGWDPVENASLIPWIVSVAAVHTMLTQKRTKGLILTNFILVIMGFVLVLYSTFLTRSGVLGDASVHSFVDPGRFAFTLLVLFMFMFTDIGFGYLFARFTSWGNSLFEKYSGWKLGATLYLIFIVPSIPIFAQISGDLTQVFDESILSGGVLTAIILTPLLWISHFLNVMSFLWIPAIILKVALIVYTVSSRVHSSKKFTSFGMMTRETFLGFGSGILAALTLIVLLGTSLPIIPQPIVDAFNGLLGWMNSSFNMSFTLGNTVEPAFYDAMGLPLAILIAGMNGFALLLKWKSNDGKDVLRKTMMPFAIAVVITIILFFVAGIQDVGMMALAFTSAFTIIINAQVGYKIIRGNPKFAGAYIAHIGIAFMFLGIIGSGFYSEDQAVELPQGVTKSAFGYNLTYVGFETFWNGERYYFKIRMDDMDGNEIETVKTIMFVSHYGGQEQIFRNPGIAHFLHKDIYLEPQALMQPDPEGGERLVLVKGESYDFGGYNVKFTNFEMNNSKKSSNFTIGAVFEVGKYGEKSEEITATRVTGPDGIMAEPALIQAGDLAITVLGMTPNKEDLAQSTIEVRLQNPNIPVDPTNMKETLVVMASLKPFILLVWIGIVLMVVGFGFARVRRSMDAKKLESHEATLGDPIPQVAIADVTEDAIAEDGEAVPAESDS
jgi:cytochrome c biogenesis factor